MKNLKKVCVLSLIFVLSISLYSQEINTPQTTGITQSAIDKYFSTSKVLNSVNKTLPDGNTEKTTILKETGFKYPLIKIREKITPATIISSREMVADHMIVKLKDGKDSDALKGLCKKTVLLYERKSKEQKNYTLFSFLQPR